MIKARARKVIAGRTAKSSAVRPPRPRALTSQVCLGEIVRWDAEGPLVDFPGNDDGPSRARFAALGLGFRYAPPSPEQQAALAGQEVVLLVDRRPGRLPVVLGLLAPLGGGASAATLDVRLDGRRVELDARDEIVLRCGEASITLRRNGRIAIRGVDVETRAAGVNRIKGGTVNIN